MNNVASLREQIVAKLYSALISDALETLGIRVRHAPIPARSMTRSCSLPATGRVSMPIHTT
jgi:hypothetical protein